MIAKTLHGTLTFSGIEPGSGLGRGARRPPADALSQINASGLAAAAAPAFPPA